jgi:hypothetical protein
MNASTYQLLAENELMHIKSISLDYASFIHVTKAILDEFRRWTDKWKLRFNFDKCKVLHLGTGNNEEVYRMINHVNGNADKLLKTIMKRRTLEYGLTKLSNHPTMWRKRSWRLASFWD